MRSMAMRVSKACSHDDGMGIILIPTATAAGTIQWPLLMSVLLVLYRTCFWAGDTFAPMLRMCDGITIQHFLQDAFGQLLHMLSETLTAFLGLRCVV